MKKITVVLLCAAAVLLSVSCTTSLRVQEYIPSEINMGSYRDLAVASVVYENPSFSSAFSTYLSYKAISQASVPNDVLSHLMFRWLINTESVNAQNLSGVAQKRLVDDLYGTGFFKLTEPATTELILSGSGPLGGSQKVFAERGIDAVLSTKVSVKSYDSFFWADDWYTKDSSGNSVKTGLKFYLYSKIVYTFEYRIIDVAKNTIVASGSETGTIERRDQDLLATYKNPATPGAEGVWDIKFSTLPSMRNFLESDIKRTVSDFVLKLAPHYEFSYMSLMRNKDRIKPLKDVYKAAEDGNLPYAFNRFDDYYKTTLYVPAGYNAAVILYAMGDLEGAIKYAQQVYGGTWNKDVYDLLRRLSYIKSNWEEALAQEEGLASYPDDNNISSSLFF